MNTGTDPDLGVILMRERGDALPPGYTPKIPWRERYASLMHKVEIIAHSIVIKDSTEYLGGTDQALKPEWRFVLYLDIQSLGKTSRSLSLNAGLDASTVSEWFRKGKTPSAANLQAVLNQLQISLTNFVDEQKPLGSQIDEEPKRAGSLNLRKKDHKQPLAPKALAHAILLGPLRAGVWQEPRVLELDEAVYVPTIPHPEFAGMTQYAWRVEGNSMDRVAKPGSYVIGVSFRDMPRPPQHRDLVVVERRDGGLVEYTLKRVAMTLTGTRLDPESDDPKWQEPAWASDGEKDGVEVVATHLVIGNFSFLT